MSYPTRIARGAACVAGLIVAVFAGLRAMSDETAATPTALAGNRCILCSTCGANQMPRICNSYNTKF